jgi:hypothetical protein
MKIFQAASEFLPMIDEVKKKNSGFTTPYTEIKVFNAAPCDAGL